MGEIEELIARVEGASGPDQALDAEMDAAIDGGFPAHICHDKTRRSYGVGFIHNDDDGSNLCKGGRHSRPLTSSLDAIVALIEGNLPGWMWRVATCSVSDDAWVAPDFNHPELGDHYLQYLSPADGSDPTEWWLEVTDVDRRPPGHPALALCAAFLKALAALQQKDAGR